jgi:2-polyprenyl-6-methoxyphenol hydroxylase-like FAD-dependent oxidoreductase
MPVVLNEFEKVDLLDDVINAGYINSEGVVFRTPAGKGNKVLGRMSLSVVPKGVNKYDYAGVHMGQHQLAAVIQRRAERFPNFEARFSHRFSGASEKGGKVHLCAVTNQGEKWFTASYVVGCDGAGSSVRRSLCIPFEGFTWNDFRFVATNVKYPFEDYGFSTANMVVDPEDWAVIARTGTPQEGIWRVAFGVRTDIPEDEILKQIPKKFEQFIPGTEEERKRVELVTASPYWAHQRVAAKYRVGRVVLAGDAAHVSLAFQLVDEPY